MFCRLDELGLVVTGQRLDSERAALACRSSIPTTGATAAAAKVCRAEPCSAGRRTSRSAGDIKTWLAQRPQAWRDEVEVVAMDGFTGFKTATAEQLPDAVPVMDP